jgi:tRNA G18 (ribose-2'-O)-methylase SpoU
VIIPIASADDPRIAAYRAVKERDLLRREGLFIVEGRFALEHLATGSRFGLESVFLAENRVAPLTPLLAKLDPGAPVYMASQDVMDQITGFHIHRGVLAMARRGADESAANLLARHVDGPLTLLGLLELANHDNVGACFRNAAALGADAIVLDEASCDPLYRKSIRVSSGAALTLPFARVDSGASLLAMLETNRIEPWALTPSGGEMLHALEPPRRVALLLGAEGPGLPAGLMGRCRRVTIPMTAGMDSLNVATAGAIALAHIHAGRMATSRA